MGNRHAGGEEAHSFIAGGQTVLKSLSQQAGVEGVVGQFGGRGACRLQHLERPPVQDPPPGCTGLAVNHIAQLLVGETISRVITRGCRGFIRLQQELSG